MKEKGYILLIVALVVFVIVAVYLSASKKETKGYQGQTNEKAGFWNSLWNNAANIVDAGGRHTSSFVTSLTNGVSSIIATKQSGKFYPSEYGYSDPKQDNGPYILGGAVLVAVLVVTVVLIKN